MPIFNRLRAPGEWLDDTAVTSDEFEAMDAMRPAVLNGVAGSTHAPTSVISVQGAGLTCPQIVTNANGILSHDVTIGTHGARLTSLEGRMSTAEGDIDDNAADIVALQNVDSIYSSTLATHGSQIGTLQGRMDDVEDLAAENASDITALQNVDTIYASTLATHSGQIGALQTKNKADVGIVHISDPVAITPNSLIDLIFTASYAPTGAYAVVSTTNITVPSNGLRKVTVEAALTIDEAATDPLNIFIGVFLNGALQGLIKGTRNSTQANDVINVNGTVLVPISDYASDYIQLKNSSSYDIYTSGATTTNQRIIVERLGDL